MAKAEKEKGKYQQAVAQIHELKEVLQMAADADTRKDSLVEEVRQSAREAKIVNDREKELLAKERAEFEVERRLVKEESIGIKSKLQDYEYSQREINSKLELT